MTFYETIIVDGKDKKISYKWEEGEYEEYEKVSLSTWGGLPTDVKWAKNTNIYKESLQKLIK